MSILRKVAATIVIVFLVALIGGYLFFQHRVDVHFKMARADSKSTVVVPANPVFTQNATLPLVSPDGKWSASLGEREWTDPKKSGAIVVKNLQTQAEHLYLIDGNGYFIDERSLSWNADSRRLIFTEHSVPNSSVKEELVIDAVAQTQSLFCRFPGHISVDEPGGKWYQENRLVIVDERWIDQGRPDRLLVTKPNSCEIDYQLPTPGVKRGHGSALAVDVDKSGDALLIVQSVENMNGPEVVVETTRTWKWNARDGLEAWSPGLDK